MLGIHKAVQDHQMVEVTVIDLAEGNLHIKVKAGNDDDACEKAAIAAAELGCRHVIDIVVGVFE